MSSNAGSTSVPTSVGTPAGPPKKKSHRWALAAVVIVVLLVVVGGSYYMGYLAGSGTVQMYLHDAPCSCEHVYVTMTSYAVLQGNGSTRSSGTWTTLSSSTETFDAMSLNGTQNAVLLASAKTTGGPYTAAEITLQNVTVVSLDGVSFSAQVSSPTVRVNGPFTVSAGGTVTLEIDLDLAASVSLTATGASFNAALSMSSS